MNLPSNIKIGRVRYDIVLRDNLPNGDYGRVYPKAGVMYIAPTHDTKPRKFTGKNGINETFWHEVTHAILHDMDSNLWPNEVFVTEFSRRLARMIETAEFKES